MSRRLCNIREELSADVASLYLVMVLGDTMTLKLQTHHFSADMLEGVEEEAIRLRVQVPLKGILGTAVLESDSIVSSHDVLWGWDSPQFNSAIDLPQLPYGKELSQLMVIPIKHPSNGQVMGVLSAHRLSNIPRRPVGKRFDDTDRRKAKSFMPQLTQLVVWLDTQERHTQCKKDSSRLSDMIALISYTTQSSRKGKISDNGGAIDQWNSQSKQDTLDQLMSLARTSLGATAAMLYVRMLPSAELRSLSTVWSLPEGTALTEEQEDQLLAKSDEWMCLLGQGMIGYCALNAEDVSTLLDWEVTDGRNTEPHFVSAEEQFEAVEGADGEDQITAPEESDEETQRLKDEHCLYDAGVDIPPGMEARAQGVACVPIVIGGECVGVFQAMEKVSVQTGVLAKFNESDITIMRILATAFGGTIRGCLDKALDADGHLKVPGSHAPKAQRIRRDDKGVMFMRTQLAHELLGASK